MIMHAHQESANTPAQEIGAAILRERNRLGLRQEELAFMAGISTRLVHQIEHGKETSRLDGIAAVLSALGLTLVVESDELRDEAGAS